MVSTGRLSGSQDVATRSEQKRHAARVLTNDCIKGAELNQKTAKAADARTAEWGAESPSQSLTSRAYSDMRADIMSGVLKPGQKLKIDELSKHYDVGNSPIREALSLLTSDAFVERNDRRGFRVVGASQEEFKELLKTRIWLESLALRESINNGTNQWEEDIILANYRLSRVPRSKSDSEFIANEEWEDLHKKYHMSLLSACGSVHLLKFCSQLFDQNTRYRHLTGPRAYPKRDIIAEHGAIADAVVARNADLAIELLVSHYQGTSGFLDEGV